MKNETTQYFRYFTYIKPFTKIPIVKNYAPTVFALITVSVLTFFAIKPTIETILVLQKQLADQTSVLQKVTEKANNLSLGKKNYDDLDTAVKNKISSAVPDSLNLKSFIQTLEEATKGHEASVSALQVQPLTIEPKNENKVGTLSEISFIFNAQGSYENLIAILQDLRRSSRVISIESLSISKTSDEKSLIMSLTGKGYYLKQ